MMQPTIDNRARRLATIWARVTAGDVTLDANTARRLLLCVEASPERSNHLTERDIERLRDAVLEAENG